MSYPQFGYPYPSVAGGLASAQVSYNKSIFMMLYVIIGVSNKIQVLFTTSIEKLSEFKIDKDLLDDKHLLDSKRH